MNGPNFVKISPRLLTPRIPELGQIKIGGKGEERTGGGGKKYRLPQKYTHFVVTKRERDKQTENLVVDTEFHQRIKNSKPTELDIRLLFDRPEQNFQYFLAAYDGRSKRCSGNGETAQDRVHGEIPCTCPWLKVHEGPYAGPARPVTGKEAVTCKPHGRLSVILEGAETFGGFYTFRTTSWESISSIAAQLELYLAQFGFLSGLPLKMVMYPTTDQYEEGGVTKTSTSYKVALVLRGSFDTARQLAASAYERREQLALPSPAQAEVHQRQLLEAEERDAAEISGEFHPESNRPAEWIEADVVEEEDPEAAAAEDLIRTALEYCDWDGPRINKLIAENSSDLVGALAELEARVPKAVKRARERVATQEEGVEDVATESESGDQPTAEETGTVVVDDAVETSTSAEAAAPAAEPTAEAEKNEDAEKPKTRQRKANAAPSEKQEGDLF